MLFRDWLQIKEVERFDKPMDTLSDNELVQAALKNNREAMDILLNRWVPRLTRWLSRRVYDSHDVDDIIQGTIVRILKAFQNGSIPRNFGTWAHAIAKNQSVDLARQKARRPISVAEPEDVGLMQGDKKMGTVSLNVGTIDNDPANIYARADTARVIAKALKDLADTGEYGARKAAMLKAYYFDQKNLKDIANKMKIPLGSVKRSLHSGKKDLARLLGQYGFDD